jgi:hypothetical protein
MTHSLQHHNDQTRSEEDKLAVPPTSATGQRLAALLLQAQCKTTRHILQHLYKVMRIDSHLAAKRRLEPGTPHATTPGSCSDTNISKTTKVQHKDKQKQQKQNCKNIKKQPNQSR